MNKNDAKFAHIIEEGKILLVDCRTMKARGLRQTMVRGIANRYFTGTDDGLQVDRGGIFLAGNLIHFVHVESVAKGIYLAAFDHQLTPDETRPIAQTYIDANPKRK